MLVPEPLPSEKTVPVLPAPWPSAAPLPLRLTAALPLGVPEPKPVRAEETAMGSPAPRPSVVPLPLLVAAQSPLAVPAPCVLPATAVGGGAFARRGFVDADPGESLEVGDGHGDAEERLHEREGALPDARAGRVRGV